MRIPRKLVQCLKSSDEIVVASHIGPEGDAIGSAIALAIGLEKLGKNVEVVFHSGVPKRYSFLPGAEKVKRQPTLQPSLLVLVDCADLDRADIPESLRESAKSVIIIDHHPKVQNRNERNWIMWVQPEVAATGEMVAALLKTLKVPMALEIATCLYAAIISDTGVFRFRNTRPETLRSAASLLEHGIDPQELAYRVMEVRSFAATKLLGRMLGKAKFDPKFGLCWSVLTRKDFALTGTIDEDTENFVNFLGAVDGAKVAILFREIEPRYIRVSLRSKDEGINVAEIARQFGGGGHPAAAGCRLYQPLSSALEAVLNAVYKSLEVTLKD
ncbi:MAG: DHH family phosphoesterase [Candidatus Fervidibacter sp.]|uniref:DHH family phosphoesterase n=1 Tax=Candidatus Fervidibacter sp. TaxID=3100871 RepID=UPI00404B057A